MKVRTPLQLYVRHLMMERLRDDPDVVEGVIKQLRKLPWQVQKKKALFCTDGVQYTRFGASAAVAVAAAIAVAVAVAAMAAMAAVTAP